MNTRRLITTLAVLLPILSFAQENLPEVDYNRPKSYIVGGISVEGNTYLSEEQIVQQTGLLVGDEVAVPGEAVNNIIKRLWMQRYFEDVQISIDSLSANRDTAHFLISITERPRVSRWSVGGLKSGERKEVEERLKFRRGGEFSEYVEKTSIDIIKRYFAEKGFLNAKVEAQVQQDTMIANAIRVNFQVSKGEKVKIKVINFLGDKEISDFKLARSMKKTKSAKFYNLFRSKKFDSKEYENDKKHLIETFNEEGFRDARLVSDSIYYVEPNRLGIDFTFDQGNKYYFRDIQWTGNSVYPEEVLDDILKIKKGDVYDVISMNKRIYGGGKQNEYDVTKLYRDNGYLFFGITPVETNIQNDSVDVELRISEGKQATLNNIIINGNDLTNEKVVRRSLYTRPGYLFRQTDFERSLREIASMGQFDPEAIMSDKGYSVIPNQMNNTVDLVYNVTEKPSSQLELSGGWGGNTFVASVGISFNNFSTHRFFEKGAWRPVPLGDAQNLSFKLQTNGSYYSTVSASFTEPWLFGKKPTSFSIGAYYSRQTDSYVALDILSNNRVMEVFGASASLGSRLKWPDTYFVLYNSLAWQTYKLKNWYSGSFIFDDGISNNLNYSIALARNSTDQQIYPREGSDISLSLALTPPYSLFRKFTYDITGKKVPVKSWRDIDYSTWTGQQRYRWTEYYKIKFSSATYLKLVGDLVLMARAQFGYLGHYNEKLGSSPFEGFLVGGDGMSGYNTYGNDVVSLRGYTNYSLTPYEISPYNANGYAYAGHVYDKFTVELRYPVMMQPSSTIYALLFLEGGNCWSDIKYFNPFQVKRSAGVGARIFLPMIGLLGVDWGWGFDDAQNGRSQFHFVIGQQF